MPQLEQIKSLKKSVSELTFSNKIFREKAGGTEVELTEEIISLRAKNEDLNRENKTLLERLREAGL